MNITATDIHETDKLLLSMSMEKDNLLHITGSQ